MAGSGVGNYSYATASETVRTFFSKSPLAPKTRLFTLCRAVARVLWRAAQGWRWRGRVSGRSCSRR